MSRYLLVSRSADFEARLRSRLGSDVTMVDSVHLADGPQAIFARAPRRPTVAILGPLLTFEETKALSDGFVDRHPEIGIVVVRDVHSDMEDWVDSMAIHAVLPPDADEVTFDGVLARLDDRAVQRESDIAEIRVGADLDLPQRHPTNEDPNSAALPPQLDDADQPRVLAIASPKGGQGKTTVAVNLAATLGEVAPNSVVLVDADLQFGDVGHVLDIPSRRTIDELVGRDSVSLKTTLMHHPGGFFVVPAPRSPEDADLVSPSALARLIDDLTGIFRYVVVDTAPGLGEHTLAVLEHSTDVVFVAQLSVASLRALYSEIRTLENIKVVPISRTVVINFVDRASGLAVKDASTIAGVPVDVAVPRSSSVALAANRGVPVVQLSPRDPAAKALRLIASMFDSRVLPVRGPLSRSAS